MKIIILILIFLLQMWSGLSYEEQLSLDPSIQASICGLSPEEFNFMAAVVEAESDRSSNTEGKVLIAETIFNRVSSENFPDSVTGVLQQSGQFTVVGAGIYKSTGSTETSQWAVVEAYRRIQQGESVNVIYFNCIGFNYLGIPYEYVDGNYFEIGS